MPGRIVHFEIPADDTTRGREFWGSLFGWQFEGMPGPVEGHVTRVSEQTGGAIADMGPGERAMRVYFDVSCRGWFSTCKHPHGNDVGLWQNDPSAPEPSA